MRYGLEWLWAFYRSPQGKKLYRYVMGSVITTVVSFAVLTVVYGVFRWWGAVASTVFANVVATVPAYWLNRTWTWGKGGRSDLWREVMPFWVLSVAGIAISMVTADLAAELGRAHDLHHLVEIVVVDGANLAAYGVLFIGKYLVFDRLFRVAESVRAGQSRQAAGASRLLRGASSPASEPDAYAASVAQVAGSASIGVLAAATAANTGPVDLELVPAGVETSRTSAIAPWGAVRVSAVRAHPSGHGPGGTVPEPPNSVHGAPSARARSRLGGLVPRWAAPTGGTGESELVRMFPADS
ncbi:MAG: GtrA family protein [Actinomycetota bacterium]|jgi:putative flippase GtrA|nr:GtrA family protein [Actinomycetota bacterium]